jgi:hypothetical protein
VLVIVVVALILTLLGQGVAVPLWVVLVLIGLLACARLT